MELNALSANAGYHEGFFNAKSHGRVSTVKADK